VAALPLLSKLAFRFQFVVKWLTEIFQVRLSSRLIIVVNWIVRLRYNDGFFGRFAGVILLKLLLVAAHDGRFQASEPYFMLSIC
jgi:hypothetical protein